VLSREQPDLDAALKALLLIAVMFAVDLAWLVAGSALTGWFRDPAINRAINVAFALLLLASVGLALLL
jgi:threonine/homoserine/homoserine lactone efflux protein